METVENLSTLDTVVDESVPVRDLPVDGLPDFTAEEVITDQDPVAVVDQTPIEMPDFTFDWTNFDWSNQSLADMPDGVDWDVLGMLNHPQETYEAAINTKLFDDQTKLEI